VALHLVRPEPARPKLIVDGVSKRFLSKRATVEALENVSLTVLEGEFVCLLGPSGCGKSTLLDIMAGLTRPDSGRVVADGQVVHGPGQQRLVMFQEPALFPWLDVMGNVLFGLKLKRGLTGPPTARNRGALPAPGRPGEVSAFVCS